MPPHHGIPLLYHPLDFQAHQVSAMSAGNRPAVVVSAGLSGLFASTTGRKPYQLSLGGVVTRTGYNLAVFWLGCTRTAVSFYSFWNFCSNYVFEF
jgi:hypothetical protein